MAKFWPWLLVGLICIGCLAVWRSDKKAWLTPIEFYGRVVDENGEAVSGAQINFSCNDLSQEGTSNYHAASDSSGGFSLKDVKGKLLVVRISREGYYTSKADNNSFEYGDSHITVVGRGNPIVFHLRKKRESAPLVINDYPGFAHIAQLKHDGTPVELDLFQGASVAAGSGQLKLELQRDLSDKNAKQFDWKLQISVSGGGLISTDEEFPFEAAKGGYQSSIVFEMPATNQNWQGQVNGKFYIQLPDGKYGRFELMFLAYNGVFTIHSAINPSGSRNLESDSGK